MIKNKPVQYKSRGKTWDEAVAMCVPKVSGINPILAMREHKANKPKPMDHNAKQIIQAGYHCGWQWLEIQTKLREAGYDMTVPDIQTQYMAHHNSIE